MAVPDDTDAASATFAARTPWSPIGAVAAVVFIVLAAVSAAGAMGALVFAALRSIGLPGGPQAFTQTGAMLLMLLMQVLIVGLTYWLAGWHGGARRCVLSLAEPLTRRLFLFGVAGMALLLVPYNLAAYLLWPEDFARDLRPFAELAHSPAATLAALVVAIGAPLSEELLFRGFLLPALAAANARTFVGLALVGLVLQMLVPVWLPMVMPGRLVDYSSAGIVFGLNLAMLFVAAFMWWRSSDPDQADNPRSDIARRSFLLASLFSTAAWTLMHLGYSILGLAEVFMIGIYFCWLMWRFANLWLTIALHALYNGGQLLVLMLLPLPAPA